MITKIPDSELHENVAKNYDTLSAQVSLVNINLLRCMDNKNVSEIPDAIATLKELLSTLEDNNISFFRRISEVLHNILISRMFYNKQFQSPLYSMDLEGMRTYSTTSVEFRNLIAIYIDAIERSIPEES